MSLEVADPRMLLALPPLALATVLLWRRSASGRRGPAESVALAVRLAVILLLVLAAAGASAVGRTDRRCFLFALDVSRSVAPDERSRLLEEIRRSLPQLRPGDRAGLLAFAGEALLEAAPGERPREWAVRSRLDEDRTDIAAALRLGLATIPDGDAGALVLVSDGNETAGRAAGEIALLRSHGVPVFTRTVTPAGDRDVRVDRVLVPTRVKSSSRYPVTVTVHADHAGAGTLRLYRNHAFVGASDVTWVPGKNRYGFWEVAGEPGVAFYEAVLSAPDESGPAANNRGEAFVWKEGRRSVLYLHGPSGRSEAFLAALAGRGFPVSVVPAGDLPVDLPGYLAHQAVVLDDVPATALTDHQMEVLASWVRDLGGGLVTLGGPRSYGAGGYDRTPVEDVLPVSMDIRQRKVVPRSTLVVVIDASGSMAYSERGTSKIRLAAEGAERVTDLLQPGDRFGLCLTDTEASWPLPPAGIRPGDRGLVRTLRSIQSTGGGIYVYTGLRSAFDRLRKDPGQVRHVILFADTADAEQPVGEGGEHVFDLAHRMLGEGISTSVVGIGHPGDKDIPLLEGLARRGGGRYVFTDDMFTIPRLFSREAMLAARPVVVEEFALVRPGDPAPWLGSIEGFPPVEGRVLVTPKPGATVAAWVGDEDPLLASWPVGLGKSVAFMSDAGTRWTGRWRSWPREGALWAQVVEWVGRAGSGGEYPARLAIEGGVGRLSVDAVDEAGRYLNFMQFKARVAAVSGEKTSYMLDLRQTAPGRYEAAFPATREGSYVVQVYRHGRGGSIVPVEVVGATVPYSPELRETAPDRSFMEWLAAQTGGEALAGDLAAVFDHEPPPREVRRDIRQVLVLLALVLFVLDIALRRIHLSAEALAAIGRRVGRWVREGAGPKRRREVDPGMERLKAAKRTGRAGRVAGGRGDGAEVGAGAGDGPIAADPGRAREAGAEGGGPSAGSGEDPEITGGDETPTRRLLAARRRARERRRNRSVEGSGETPGREPGEGGGGRDRS